MACLTPPPKTATSITGEAVLAAAVPPPLEAMKAVDAWSAAAAMSPGINIGNTLDNTTRWETGWGQPLITKEYVQRLAALGFRTVRLPVAWDTYALDGVIQPDKFERVREVMDWITEAGMFCVLNIHWDGGWIDSSHKEHFTDTFATFSPIAEKKYRSYWTQIATFFAGKSEKVIFESLNEETNFENAGSPQKAFETLTRVNQIFIDTVRKTGGNNAQRLLMVAGYATDITKTCDATYKLPTDTIAHRLFISVHYYTPWQFVGMSEDADWGKMSPTWGNAKDVEELVRLFDMMGEFTKRNDIPAFIGELNVVSKKEAASRIRWLKGVFDAARSRKMVPVLWDTGGDVSRNSPYDPSPEFQQVLQHLAQPPVAPTPVEL